jgi:hypothetical protein
MVVLRTGRLARCKDEYRLYLVSAESQYAQYRDS